MVKSGNWTGHFKIQNIYIFEFERPNGNSAVDANGNSGVQNALCRVEICNTQQLNNAHLDSMKLGGDPIQIAPGVRHLDRQEFLIILR